MRRLTAIFALVSLLSLSIFVSSVPVEKYSTNGPYKFEMLFGTDEIEAKAGENVTFNVTVLNLGSFSLRDFEATLSGSDYNYSVTPKRADVSLWGEWDSKNGLKRGQQNFQVTVFIPSDATGVHLTTLTGRENFSWRKVTQNKTFILKIIPSVEPNVTVSNILVPESIKENQTFEIKFLVSNKNSFKQQFDFSLSIPSDWHSDDTRKSLLLEPLGSANVSFAVTPTNSSGNISVDVVYPFKKNIFSVSRDGKTLGGFPAIGTDNNQEPVPRATGFARIMEFLKNLSPIVLSIMVLIAIIVIWFIVKIIRFYSSRKNPEAMKKLSQAIDLD